MQVFSNKKWFPVLLLIISSVAAIMLSYYWYSVWEFAIVDGLINATAFTLSIWAAGFVTKRYPTHVAAIIYSIIIGGIAGLTSYSLSGTALQWWFYDDADIIRYYEPSIFTRKLLHCLAACWIISFSALKKINEELEDKINHVADAATLHKEAELFKLRQQLQPHFLYNSLNSINALIISLPEQAQEMVGKLSDFLRASVKRDTEKDILVSEELQYIENYLAIEMVRFGERLKVIYEKQFEADAAIPSFLLQPILENAIKFGLYGNTSDVLIKITIIQEADIVNIQIENPFDNTMKPLSGTGFGLEGVNRRLYLLYGRTDLLETKNEDNIFITRLKIPQQNVQGSIDR